MTTSEITLASNRRPTDLPEATGCLGMRKSTKWKIVSIGSGVGALATAGSTAYAVYAMITAGLCATGIGAVIGGGAVLFIALAILAVKAWKESKSARLDEARVMEPPKFIEEICLKFGVARCFKCYYDMHKDEINAKFSNNRDGLSKVVKAATSLAQYERPPSPGSSYADPMVLLTTERVEMLIRHPEIAEKIATEIQLSTNRYYEKGYSNMLESDIDIANRYLEERDPILLKTHKSAMQANPDDAIAIAITAYNDYYHSEEYFRAAKTSVMDAHSTKDNFMPDAVADIIGSYLGDRPLKPSALDSKLMQNPVPSTTVAAAACDPEACD